ncbi:MAG: oxidoreductase, partial [Deltaproteobacteria bacterium]|nr:oxidoreductase [Deltaproteobacteria bacterium]
MLIAGGCGLAPLRSLIQYCQDRTTEFAAVHIFYGARSPVDLMFRDELPGWQISDRFSCRYTVDQLPATSCYAGDTGLITKLLTDLQIDADNCCAVVVGPPPMYRPVINELRRL